jgi:hypothetical protein
MENQLELLADVHRDRVTSKPIGELGLAGGDPSLGYAPQATTNVAKITRRRLFIFQ